MSNKLDKILRLFLDDSYRKFNVREVARLTKLSPSTASKHLMAAVKNGILTKEESRNLLLFSANLESHKFRDLKIYSNVKNIKSSGLVDFIEKELNFPEIIILFGSYSKGENKKDSCFKKT